MVLVVLVAVVAGIVLLVMVIVIVVILDVVVDEGVVVRDVTVTVVLLDVMVVLELSRGATWGATKGSPEANSAIAVVVTGATLAVVARMLQGPPLRGGAAATTDGDASAKSAETSAKAWPKLLPVGTRPHCL
mmetsp:Transcript_128660/g.274589  ORF Transcript_128660/g.274589 Transcript_128660/m.274589 type:complete len:132 (-) Transcript_128660:1519-1914(-)